MSASNHPLRDAFHSELTATAEELSKAMGLYARRSEAALASFMEKVATRGVELEAAAAVRLNQFRGLPANGRPPNVDNKPLAHTPTNTDVTKSELLRNGQSRRVCMSITMGIASRCRAAQ